MSVLISRSALERRRAALRQPSAALAPLAASLRRDLQPLIERGPEIPLEKALLSRDGGRCPRDGVALDFDPYRPREHRCPVCGELFTGDLHYLAWVMWYQLWLAERAVHAAALHALGGDASLAELATGILSGYSERYLHYPNQDNVLGPGRLFFSTYLESIWLLQLCVALDLLELAGAAQELGGVVRDRVVEPSVALIASYDEGRSNRQVWNDAALSAAGRLLDDHSTIARAVTGPSGVFAHIEHGLLSDGSWYEGENYHFFAHRGLWYGVMMAERAEIEIPPALRARFQEGFAAPLATALPDFTFPSRRDSQYGISLRQWRFAESLELGLACAPDTRLAAALSALYAPGAAPSRDAGRWRSTAESERNEPAAALTRADLGWRSLLFALETPRALDVAPAARSDTPPRSGRLFAVTMPSVLMEGQGIAVLRRSRGRVYTALDYGQSGGGHGHPDRLNVLLARGEERWLDDTGTGSYVDPSLHWYRSTLAHDAPLVDGRSQPMVAGVLRAFEERDDEIGWVDAELPAGSIAPGVRVRRSLVAMPSYSIDRLEWESERDVRLELPLHFVGEPVPPRRWEAAPIGGSPALEDGFAFVHATRRTAVAASEAMELRVGSAVGAWVVSDVPTEWWHALAPGAPGQGERGFYVLRMHGRRGTVHSVWNWASGVRGARLLGQGVAVELLDGAAHAHAASLGSWEIDVSRAAAPMHISLGGARTGVSESPAPNYPPRTSLPVSDEVYLSACSHPITALSRDAAVRFELGRESYRVSEQSWEEAGRPRAEVSFLLHGEELAVDVDVAKSPLCFRQAGAPDPRLDNENPDINSDGVQLHFYIPRGRGLVSWLAVPEAGGRVRIHPGSDTSTPVPLEAHWRPTNGGYQVSFTVPLDSLGMRSGGAFGAQVVINDMTFARTRRRGQLVLGSRSGVREHVYLRGDREDPLAYARFVLGDA